MNKFILLVSCLGVLQSFVLQNEVLPVSWDTLQDVPFREAFVKEIGGYMLFPNFTPALKKLDGKIVRIEGYVVPFDKTGAKIALSANSYAACFFCGKAGPASVMTINLKVPNTKYRTDQYRSFKGKLRLNEKDVNEFYYILEGAEQVKQ
ncbi:hypothetical protein SAMN05518672_10219 [Chitinophaga sp. CF118]|uniref:hypothetical protein n=1 Tax=Chitinophaga sp. CF118 TaxID=1884367 RepID=UPI0008F3F176|nr:hypothetical protein [Chitinophaga sp. CF118]SFD45572.1 hypothetical protein SAMN05518672_10219 [Chitinophaga sp. CF118]